MCTSRAPASYIMRTIFTEVVPRTIESSSSTTRLSCNHGAVGIVLELDAERADGLGGLDEGAAHIVIADDAEFEGNAGLLGIAQGGGHA